MDAGRVEVLVLGIAQDAGVPQLGCSCARCQAAHRDPGKRRLAAALAVVDHTVERFWLIEATPNIVEQVGYVQAMAPGAALSGVMITHAHMGHVLGLAHFGREAAATGRLPVYVTHEMDGWLRSHAPWSQLVELHNIEPMVVDPTVAIRLSEELRVEAIPVPHRAEATDTVAWSLIGSARSLFFCPDIDFWDDETVRAVSAHDIALVDGTFFSEGELPSRGDRSPIPHPTIIDTMGTMDDLQTDVRFIHLNHTNPLHDKGPERAMVRERGFGIAARGDRISLA